MNISGMQLSAHDMSRSIQSASEQMYERSPWCVQKGSRTRQRRVYRRV